MEKFYYKKNFLSQKECEYLINFFNQNQNNWSSHRCTLLIDLHNFMHVDFMKQLYGKISKHCIDNLDENCYINYHQIVKWGVNCHQPKHLDFDYHQYTSIIYLNDNFIGGETVVGRKIIRPETGKIISFTGNRTIHEVLEVTDGIRYTLPVWYKVDNFK